MLVSPTTLADLSVAQFGQLIEADLFPHAVCQRCAQPRSVVIWGAEGWNWAAACAECDLAVLPQAVTFLTSMQFHNLIEHGIPVEVDLEEYLLS